MLCILATHRVGHGPDEAEGRGHGLGILAEDEAEVDVEHLPRRVDLDGEGCDSGSISSGSRDSSGI